jgi:chemotaxis signal transduction protein
MALDPRVVLGLAKGATKETCLILFKPSVGPSFGLLVDEIGDIVAVESEQIENFGPDSHELSAGMSLERAQLITKVCKLPSGLLLVLEPRKFVRLVERAMGELSTRENMNKFL